jgi:hypothetical protein
MVYLDKIENLKEPFFIVQFKNPNFTVTLCDQIETKSLVYLPELFILYYFFRIIVCINKS